MEIRENSKVCVLIPLVAKLDSYSIKRIFDKVEKESRRVAIDMNYVQECTVEFFERLKKITNKDLGLFNISSDIFVLLNVMDIDKTAKLYVSEMDFEEDSRQLINRKFALV